MPAGGRHKKAITVEEIAFFWAILVFIANKIPLPLDWTGKLFSYHFTYMKIVLLVITTEMVGSSGL